MSDSITLAIKAAQLRQGLTLKDPQMVIADTKQVAEPPKQEEEKEEDE